MSCTISQLPPVAETKDICGIRRGGGLRERVHDP